MIDFEKWVIDEYGHTMYIEKDDSGYVTKIPDINGMFRAWEASRNFPKGAAHEAVLADVSKSLIEAQDEYIKYFHEYIDKILPYLDLKRLPVFDIFLEMDQLKFRISELKANFG